ncbi:MAG: hypothetical protein JSR21_10580 [Proteobacteria bacterium]|nr:hypothetical protein [Pseudomonadota bacterium]
MRDPTRDAAFALLSSVLDAGRSLDDALQALPPAAQRDRAAAQTAVEARKAEAGGNADPVFADPALDHRLFMIARRLIGLMARIQLRLRSARGRARANAPGAVEKRREAALRRAEAKAAFVRETNLDPRYMPLKRPLGQEPPPRRSRGWQTLQELAAVIDGVDDRTVLREAWTELAGLARRMQALRIGDAIEAVARKVLALFDAAPSPEAPGAPPRPAPPGTLVPAVFGTG